MFDRYSLLRMFQSLYATEFLFAHLHFYCRTTVTSRQQRHRHLHQTQRSAAQHARAPVSLFALEIVE
jgi:hypothetical protein